MFDVEDSIYVKKNEYNNVNKFINFLYNFLVFLKKSYFPLGTVGWINVGITYGMKVRTNVDIPMQPIFTLFSTIIQP